MLKSCPYCGRLHPVGLHCPKHTRIRNDKISEAVRFRNTSHWRKVRESVRERDYYICRVCLANGTWSAQDREIEVHHIIPLSENFALRDEQSNLICLCHHHHEMAEAQSIEREYLAELAKAKPKLPARG